MHRITKNKITSLQIAVVVVFMAMTALATKPAQAKFGMVGGYKYVAVQHNLEYQVHVGQIDFMWSVGGGGQGYRDGGKRPHQAFGFGLAVGGNSATISTTIRNFENDTSGDGVAEFAIVSQSYAYFALPLIYEYVFPFGLGITVGLNAPIMVVGDDESRAGAGIGIGISDVGLSYHFKNGLTFYTRVNVGYAAFYGGNVIVPSDSANASSAELANLENIGSKHGLMWGAGAGIGYWF